MRAKTIRNKYGKVAIEATKHIQKTSKPPRKAWQDFAEKTFGAGTDGANKGCPRNAYLGLCEDGLVVGVPKDNYVSNGNLEKLYAVQAVRILQRNQTLENKPKELWKKVMIDTGKNPNKTHNSQMNVVLALWHEGMIVRSHRKHI